MALDRNVVSWLRAIGYITLTCFCFLLIQSRQAFGQVDEGAISGTVQDTSGALVPNATVTLLNTDQGITLQTKTNSSGVYIFSPVRIGHYTVTVTAKGFAKTTQQNLVVNVAQSLLVNVQLKPGAATETVEVTTAPPLLQTEEASVGQVISQEAVNALPLNGRNFTFLAQLGAGMQTPQADTRGNAASGAFSANGLRPAQNNYLLDGIDNNSNAVDFLNGTNFVILPPLDAIQEFKVQTADFSAELGRSAGAVLNATIKSGTNSLHGAAWEFFRNDKLDAADYFEDANHIAKGELRLNQFGGTGGGPIIKNKLFFFGDYEGKRRVQGNTASGLSVPTAAERSSSYANLADRIGGTARADALGRMIVPGTIMDPATTRSVTALTADPVTGIVATTTGYVRDPIGYNTCSSSARTAPTTAACPGLNQLPNNRIDPNAVKLLNLYPAPTSSGITNNFGSSPNLYEHSNSFDTREDFNPSEKDQIFFRFSYVDDPQYIPGPFGGIADGGAFQEGIQTAKSSQAVAGYTHVFNPNTINQVRAGFAHLHTTRYGPEGGSTTNIPMEFGIQGIQQGNENGGLPNFTFNDLSNLGSNNFLPSDEVSQTLQVTDDFTKIYGKHSFKLGIEVQHVKFSTLQPAWSRGAFDYSGQFTDIPGLNSNQTAIAQILLPPALDSANSEGETIPASVAFNYSGGSDDVRASNISKTYDEKNYLAAYFQDDWKVGPKLTINLGLRWDYFGPIGESNGGQANFIQSGPPDNQPEYLIPASGKDTRTLSSTATNPSLAGDGFLDLLAADGIALRETDHYGNGLLQTQKANFAPRAGFAYQVNPNLVARGGFGVFYNSFENQGYGPNIGENYPFVYNFNYQVLGPGNTTLVAPVSIGTPFAGCSTAGPGGTATLEAGFSCIGFSPTQVNASGLGLQGLQFDYKTPLTISSNVTLQYSLTRTLSLQASYVVTHGENLQDGIGDNDVTAILPYGASTTSPAKAHTPGTVPFPDFGQGGSYQRTIGISTYNGLQTKLEQQFANGLTYLLAYTWSKTLSDAGDLLNGGSTGSNRAPWVPGFGPTFDRGLADFDLRQVFHFSGGYQLPFGKDKRFLNTGGVSNAVLGGWAVNWITTLQGGQPITLGCPTGTTSGTGCNDVPVAGQSQKLGLHTDSNGKLSWFGNPAAFQQPCQLGVTPAAPAGCIAPTTLAGYLGAGPSTTTGPGFHRLDFSTFKAFQVNERISMQFRAEFFNIVNHPNFNAPNFGGNGVVAISNSGNFNSSNFGEIGSTRDAPYDPRQIQFALKLYY